MSLFVYVTEACEKSALSHGLQEELTRFRDRVEAAQDVRLFDPFPPPYLVKKKFGSRQGRLIASMDPDVSGHSVVVFLGVLIRGEAAYENQFSRDPVGYGKRHFEHLFTKADLFKYVSQRTAVAPPPEKPEPTLAEYGYLHQVFTAKGDDHNQELICESIDWVQRVAEAPFKNRLESLLNALSSAKDDAKPGGRIHASSTTPGLGILTRHFPEHNIRLVACPTQGTADIDRSKLTEALREVLNSANPTREMVLQASRRAYPSLLLADLDLWSELQKDLQANLALSPEETNLLGLAKRPEGGFPLFINGRAGSGKTTLLQYLFAEFMFYHLTCEERAASPVYFTCSAELLTQSRIMVEKLIRCNSQWWHQEDREGLIEKNQPELDEAFKEFHSHLYSLLTPQEQAEQFLRDKYVSYSTFKRLWHVRFGKEPAALRDHGPDISWHVIRSYVKGLTSDELTDPEEYQQLDQKQISVTQKTYELVFDRVWTRWYKTLGETQGYWDDQDIARHLIENDRVKPHFSAVFCDESQDFTRIELELLLRFSVYSNRKIDPTDIARVPFIFAGDQFQTLNPTGFRWEAIKASFVEKFILAMDPARRSRLNDLNYQELMLNYRSSRTIVRFSNFVQALRTRLFELTGIQPQIPWDRDKGVAAVVGVKRDNATFWTQLKRERDIAIIVPCGEGEELDFIRADPTLASKIKIEDKVPDALVLSPARAKGLEFNRVVVYGFGEVPEAKGNLLDPLRGKGDYASDPDKALPFQYFINRLYVAVSRPKRRLFIVDSDAAFKNFWAFAHDEGYEGAILNGIKDGDKMWRPNVGRLEFGSIEDLSADRLEDPRKQADALARQGRANGDPYMLRHASASYRNLNDALEADRCKAEALYLEQNYLDAGNVFLSCSLIREAVGAFWRGGREGGWRAIVDTAETQPEINTGLEFAFSQLIVHAAATPQAIKAFGRLAEALAMPEQLPLIAGNPAWPVAVRAVLDRLNAIKAEPAEWSQLAILLEKIASTTTLVAPSARAWVQYRAGAMAKAADLWEQCKETTGQDYKIAKAYSSPFPQKILHLVELDKFSEAVQQCADNPEVQLPASLTVPAVRAHLHQGLNEKALHFASSGRSPEMIWEVINASGDNDEIIARAFGVLFAVAADRSDVATFISYAERGHFGGQRPSAKLLQWIEAHRPFVNLTWLRGLARTPSVADITWDDRKSRINQKPMAEFLRKTLFQAGRPNVPPSRLEELGTVIEFFGNRSDAVAFYEWARSSSNGGSLSTKAATERWLVCKEKQAKHEESRGDLSTAKAHRSEAHDMRLHLGNEWLNKTFPEYPDCGPAQALIDEYFRDSSPLHSEAKPEVSRETREPAPAPSPSSAFRTEDTASRSTAKLPAKFETMIGQFKVEYFRAQQKLVLRNESDGSAASFKPAQRIGQPMDVDIGPAQSETGLWSIPAWSMEVDASESSTVSIRLQSLGVHLKIDVGQDGEVK